jgi:predicted esterase
MTQASHAHQFIIVGSGGSEHELVPLAEELAPGLPVLAVRGTVAIDGAFAFFHRLPDRSIDEADIGEWTPVLPEFIQDPMVGQGIAWPPVAIGFSNGANHGGGTAADPSEAPGGCVPVPTSLTVHG